MPLAALNWRGHAEVTRVVPEVELGEEIYVEVCRTNKETGKTLLRELSEPEEEPSAA